MSIQQTFRKIVLAGMFYGAVKVVQFLISSLFERIMEKSLQFWDQVNILTLL